MGVDAGDGAPGPLSPRERARELLEELRMERRIAAALLVLLALALGAVQAGYAVAAERLLVRDGSTVSSSDAP